MSSEMSGEGVLFSVGEFLKGLKNGSESLEPEQRARESRAGRRGDVIQNQQVHPSAGGGMHLNEVLFALEY